MNVITATQPAETTGGSTSPTPAAISRNTRLNAKVAVAWLAEFTDAKLIVAVGVIIQSLTGNPLYPSPLPTLAAIVAAQDAYMVAVNAAKDRGKLSIAQRKQARALLVQLLRELALYVQRVCAGDPVTLIASGFPAQRGRGQPVGVLSAPQNVRLRHGRLTGQMVGRCERVDSAGTYQWRYATALTPTVWTQADAVLKASYTIAGLTAGTQYIVQARVIGTNGPSDWSDSATLMSL